MRYDRACKNLDRHPNYILAAYMVSGGIANAHGSAEKSASHLVALPPFRTPVGHSAVFRDGRADC
ncbi:hypothetical protein, partial [Micromonospora sp. NPDC006431]|uniref:hypothetical protein n=1 Tax=Micromonospora sp. NPDC006431 TaxID=3364235 RepID=UPI00369DC8A6